MLLGNCASIVQEQKESPLCEIHKIPLTKKTGYAPSEGTYADPSMRYIRFRTDAEHLYPHLAPWYLSERSKAGWDEKEVVTVCRECQNQFDEAYRSYRAQ